MLFHIHEYKRIGKPKHLRYDIDGTEVLTALCKCQICGKETRRKFIGHIVGNMLEK